MRFVPLLFFLIVWDFSFSQKNSTKYNAFYMGIDLYQGFDKAKELVSLKSTSMRMERGFSPKIGYLYQGTEKLRLFLDIGYSFITSSKYDTLVNNEKKSFYIKSRGGSGAILFDYYLVSKIRSEFAINFGVSINGVNELIEINKSLNKVSNYSKVGFKIGVSYKTIGVFDTPIRLFYKKLGNNNLLGLEWVIPFLRV